MAQLPHLSTELLLCVASHLRQVDLLNVSLTCKFLRETTERELFREYRNRTIGLSHPVANFVYRILKKPELAKYVKTVNIKGWDTLDSLHPRYHEPIGLLEVDREKKALAFAEMLHQDVQQPDEMEYHLLTTAAKIVGAISTIFPYEQESSIIKKATPMLSSDDAAVNSNFHTYLFDDTVPMDGSSYDRRFCQLLRAGVDDAYAMLLFSLLPNVHDIFIRGACSNPTALDWPQPKHKFQALRRLRAAAMNMELTWGIGHLNTMLNLAPNLSELLLHNVASWFQDVDDELELEERARPLDLRPGSLNVTKLQLVSSALSKADMQNLIAACPKLKSLQYYTGSDDTGPYNFGPRDLVEILEPLKDTLEELCGEIEPYWTDLDVPRIVSMSHFRSLKLLDTVPTMWDHMSEVDFDISGSDLSEENRLSNRIPASLNTLIFHVSNDEELGGYDSIHPEQILDLVYNHAAKLLHLRHVFVGFTFDEESADDLRSALEEVANQLDDLEVTVKTGVEAYGPTRTFLAEVPQRDRPSLTRWFEKDQKYAVRREKRREFDQAIQEVKARAENAEMDDYELQEVIDADAKVIDTLEKIRLHGFPSPTYESEDADEE